MEVVMSKGSERICGDATLMLCGESYPGKAEDLA